MSVLFPLTRLDFYLFLIALLYIFLRSKHWLPEVESIRKLMSTFDDRGGNIAILCAFTAWFFSASMGVFYYAFWLMSQKVLDDKNALIMMCLSWATGSMTGGAFSALLKTLTGSMTVAPPNAAGTGVPQPPNGQPKPEDPKP